MFLCFCNSDDYFRYYRVLVIDADTSDVISIGERATGLNSGLPREMSQSRLVFIPGHGWARTSPGLGAGGPGGGLAGGRGVRQCRVNCTFMMSHSE